MIASAQMLGVPNLRDMWRVLKEVDLNEIRRDAERRFQIQVVAEDLNDAERLAGLLSGSAATHHPWLLPTDLASASGAAGSGMVDLAVVLTPTPSPSPVLTFAIDAFRETKVPFVMVVFGSRGPIWEVSGPGEAARVAVAGLEPSAVPAVARALLATVSPGMRLALARHLVPLRHPLFTELIEETAKTNAMYALTAGLAEVVPVLDLPLNMADIVVLTKNQLIMSYRIALASGKTGTPRELVGEALGVIGSGFLFRQGARQLVGLIPVAGIVPKVAIAYAGTVAIGKTVVAWATYGTSLERGATKRIYQQALSRGKDTARTLVAQARQRVPRSPWLRPRRG